MKLGELAIGQSAKIINIKGKGELHNHLLDMGLTPGTVASLRKKAPMGDPIEIEIRGYELTLRLAEADNIEVELIESVESVVKKSDRYKPIEHPRVGELGKAQSYRDRKIGNKIKSEAKRS